MSDHAEKKKDEKPAEGGEHGEAKKKGGIGALLTKLPVLLGGAMAIEAIVMLIAIKLLAGGPKAADAAVVLNDPAHAAPAAEHEAPAGGHDAPAAGHDAPAAEHGEPAAGGHDAPAEHEPAAGGHDAPAGHGGEGEPAPAAAPVDPKKQIEIMVVEFRAPNKIGGKTFLYDVSMYAVVKARNKTQVETAFKERGALIKDRVRTIIAQSDPDKLGGGAEPGLETLRRQVRYQLEQIVGEGLIDEVLVPRCIPFRTDF